jgi:hypothetical protein
MLRVYIGFDPVETVAYHVCVQSILKHSTVPVSFCPVNIRHMPEFTRPVDPKASNEFSLSRFMVPYLQDYKGKALFMDCDMILRTDIKELFDQIEDEAVMVVKHNYTPKTNTKFLGAIQFAYPRKNWSSVMLFNCEKCTQLTPEYVSTASPADLHRFKWTDSIGRLDPTWNHLVGEYEPKDAKLVHWTLGTPCFYGYGKQEHAQEWYDIKAEMNYNAN